MIYRNFQDLKISNLALGCMRLPVIDKNDSNIDIEETKKIVAYAIENGVNYFDTAWGYHNGNSETVIGDALSSYDRSSFYLATKFPGYSTSNFGKAEEIFYKQLKKLKTDYFDFYLFHNVCEANIEYYLDEEKYHTAEFLKKMKEEGKIRHLGFSIHGTIDTMKRFMEKFGDIIEFCQIQLNYVDFDFQDAKLKINYLNERNIPIWIMEPVRGGKLASIDNKYLNKMKKYRDLSAVEWAFRYVQGTKGVTTILSGMSDITQLKENIDIFKTDEKVNADEKMALEKIGKEMVEEGGVPCTSCRYCTTYCPQNIDIPEILKLYNDDVFTGGSFRAAMLVGTLDEDKKPSSCISCKSCEAVCPQSIKISDIMTDFTARIKKNPFA